MDPSTSSDGAVRNRLGTVHYLVMEKKIKSVSLCHDGLARGSRLISYASVCDYLEALAAEQQDLDGNPNPLTEAQARTEEGGAA